MHKPLRWSKTMGAYKKYAYIFQQGLPTKIKVSSITQVGYIRDVIAFAHEHDLPGGTWYGKVKISAVEGPAAYICNKENENASIEIYPTRTVFEVIEDKQNGTLVSGSRVYLSDGVDALEDIAEDLGVKFKQIKDNLVEFLPEVEEI